MNDTGSWSWKASRQQKRQPSADDRRYIKTVTLNKKKASERARTQAQRVEARAIRKRNMEPLY